MPIAKKIQGFLEKGSWIRKMFEEGNKLRAQYGDENVFDFSIGSPATEPPEEFQSKLLEIASHPIPGMHRYMSNAGYEETRAAVAAAINERCEQTLTANHVVMSCGAGAVLNVVLKTILNQGDEVIVLSPYFVDYLFYTDNHGGVPVIVKTDESFQPDLGAIEAAITKKTRAILINNPNNPTGVIYPAETLTAIGDLLARKEQEFGTTIIAISDEPYAKISYGQHVPCIFDCIANSVIVTSHSKDLSLPGERIGYLAANPRLKDVGLFMHGTVFSNRVLGFINAPALMQRLVTDLQNANVDVEAYRRKRDMFYNKLTELGFECVKPEGAFYLFPKVPIADEMEFIRKAQEYRILIVPGSGFGGPGYFRIAYCTDEDTIERSFPMWEQLAKELGLKKS